MPSPVFPTTALSRERAAHAKAGKLTLQVCRACGRFQYPSRQLCQYCLAGDLDWSEVAPTGAVLATAVVHASLEPSFREGAPWRICSVALDAGPRIIAHAPDAAIESGDPVLVIDQPVDGTRCVLVASTPPHAGSPGVPE